MTLGRPPFSLRQLAYFTAVADHGSYRRAAEALNMSQPPLSQQMQLLEQQIGTALFDRTSRKVRLTLAGEEMLAQARRLLSSATMLGGLVRAIGRGEAGSLRVGLTDEHLGGPSFNRLLSFMRDHPSVSVEMTVAYTVDLVRQLEAGELDLALCNEPARIDEATLVRHELAPSSILVAANRDMALDGAEIDVQSLRSLPLILAPPSCQTPFSLQCRSLIAMPAGEPERCVYTSSTAAGIHMAAAGIGVSFISEYMVGNLPPSCRALRISSPLARIGHALAVQRRQLSPAVDHMVARLVEAM